MEQSFWNSQMQFSAVLPNFAKYLEQMARDSENWSEGRRFDRIPYGSDSRQWVERTAGTGDANILPVIIHGGYWRALRAEDHRFMMAGFAGIGTSIANLEYRLMPEVRLSDCVSDVKEGLLSLLESSSTYRLLLVGHSAGAHLAVSAIDDPQIVERTHGVIALSGVYDLRPAKLSFLQSELHLTDTEVATHSLYPEEGRPPVLYVNGRDETHEFMRGSALMASKGRAAWEVLDGNHMSLTWQAVENAPQLVRKLSAL